MAEDSYLAIATIADDETMRNRMNACVTQQVHLGNAPLITNAPLDWVALNRYIWASSPGWGAAWDSALAAHPDDPDYKPGADGAVITDLMILATVQHLGTPEDAE